MGATRGSASPWPRRASAAAGGYWCTQMAELTSLNARAARGASWSGLSTIILRLGGFVVGIVLAPVLTPAEFGTYALALAVQATLMTVADLGLSADIIRSEDPDKIAPTVATLGLIAGTVVTLITVSTSNTLADIMGSPD